MNYILPKLEKFYTSAQENENVSTTANNDTARILHHNWM